MSRRKPPSFADIRAKRLWEAKPYIIGSSSASSKSNDDGPSAGPPSAQDPPPKPLFGELPSSVDIKTSPERGRGIYAKEHLKRGGTILITKPPIYVLLTKNLEHFCSSCISPASATGLKRCTQCKNIRYCNAVCQTNDWAMHKSECAAMQRWAAQAPPDMAIPGEPIRCLGRVLWGKKKRGLKSVWTRELDAMQSHRTAVLPPEAVELQTNLIRTVLRYLDVSDPDELVPFGIESVASIVDLVSRFTTNSITLTSPSLAPLGVCVSPLVALINHSCDPNAVVVFPRSAKDPVSLEPEMHVVPIRDISPGEEIFTSYIDTTLPRVWRQEALSTTYNFTCGCQLCSQPPEPNLREAFACPKKCGGACPFPSEVPSLTCCVKCKSAMAYTDETWAVLHAAHGALEKATRIQFSDAREAQRLTSTFVTRITSANALPSSHPLLGHTRLYQSLLLAAFPPNPTQDALDELIRLSFASVKGLSAILPHGHPARALALAELGKLLAVDEPAPRSATAMAAAGAEAAFPPSGAARLCLACEMLIGAREELLISFGEGSEVGREVRETVVRIERELAAWSQGIRNFIKDTPSLKKGGK